MNEKTKERILPKNSFININKEFFIKVIITLKSNNMDYSICESLYIYRIKYSIEKNRKKNIERKLTILDSNNELNEDIENVISKIFKKFEVDGQIIILSLFILEKFMYKSKIILDENNLIKLVVISLVETKKFYMDNATIDTKLICSILKIDNDMLVNLEFFFLGYIDYKLKIDEDKFFTYKQKIMIPWIDYFKSFL